jgi:hypothetical protein
VIEYIKDVLGIDAKIDKWNQINSVPYYLMRDKEYTVLQLLGTKCLVIDIKSDSFNIPQFLKQQIRLNEITDYPIILKFSTLTAYQRKALIENKMPFIVPGSQLYLPFLGIYLQEYYRNVPKIKEKFTSMAQFVFLYLLYNPNENGYTMSQLSVTLGIRLMSVTRSIQELLSLGIVHTNKKGRMSYAQTVETGKKLFEIAKPYMISPVQKKYHLLEQTPHSNFLIAGEEALSMKSFLNPPNKMVRAVSKKSFAGIDKKYFIDPDWDNVGNYIELEVWKYNPETFAKDNLVDSVSLSLSLQDIYDERLESEVQDMLEDIKW